MEENRRSGSQGGIAELRRLWILEEENRKLKQLVANLSLDNKKMLEDVLSKKTLRPALQRVLVGEV